MFLVLPVDSCTEMALSKSEGALCRVFSPVMDDGVRSFDLNDIEQGLQGKDWTNYIRGVISELDKRNYKVGPFNAVIS